LWVQGGVGRARTFGPLRRGGRALESLAMASDDSQRREDSDKVRGGPGDPYARVDYRRMIAWQQRIAREGPLLLELLDTAPDRSLLDLGCGTGEHVAFFAEQGARAVGLDSSASMIDAAREHELAGHGRFVLGDALRADHVLGDEAPFGMALCLGNVLPHLTDDEQLDQWITALHQVLLPGGLALVQLLNYWRLLEGGQRHLPLNFRPVPEDQPGSDRNEIVFLRLMRDEGDGRVLFFPTTLQLDPDADEPVRVVSTRRVPLRAWLEADLHERLEAAGFTVEFYGDMTRGPFEPSASQDLVFVARRD